MMAICRVLRNAGNYPEEWEALFCVVAHHNSAAAEVERTYSGRHGLGRDNSLSGSRSPDASGNTRAAPTLHVRVPAGTRFNVRILTRHNLREGEKTFKGQLENAVSVNGREIVPRGTDIIMKVTTDLCGQQTARFQINFLLNGRSYQVNEPWPCAPITISPEIVMPFYLDQDLTIQ